MSVIARLFVLYFKCTLHRPQTTKTRLLTLNKVPKSRKSTKKSRISFSLFVDVFYFQCLCQHVTVKGLRVCATGHFQTVWGSAAVLADQSVHKVEPTVLYSTVQYSTVRWSLLEWTLRLCSPRQSPSGAIQTHKNSTKTCVLHVWSQYTHLIKWLLVKNKFLTRDFVIIMGRNIT